MTRQPRKRKRPTETPARVADSVWQGPEIDGITQSLLQTFFICRHRFYLKTVKGFTEIDRFNHALEYGNLFHEAMEAHSRFPNQPHKIKESMEAYKFKLKPRYPTDLSQIDFWGACASRQFPMYQDFWAKADKHRESIYQEETFRCPYLLPSGRTVTLRGKWDGVFQDADGIWLLETKTKGRVNPEGIMQQLVRDLQVMIYLIALQQYFTHHVISSIPIKGVVYNVIRRPLGDNRAIKQRKTESKSDFLDRIFTTPSKSETSIYPMTEHKSEWFKRWKVLISPREIDRFRRECLDPVLEQLCDWWDSIKENFNNPWTTNKAYPGVYNAPLCSIHGDKYMARVLMKCQLPSCKGTTDYEIKPNPYHFLRPFGIYDALSDGMNGAFHDYINSGGTARVKRTTNLFPELSEE